MVEAALLVSQEAEYVLEVVAGSVVVVDRDCRGQLDAEVAGVARRGQPPTCSMFVVGDLAVRVGEGTAAYVTSFSAFMSPLLGGTHAAVLVGPHAPFLVDLRQGEEAAQQVLHHAELARLFSGPLQRHPMLTGNLKARAPHRHVGKGSHAVLLGKDSWVWKWRRAVENFKVGVDHARMQSSRRPGLVVNAILSLRSVRHLQSRRDALARFQRTDLSSKMILESLRAGEVGHAAVASVPGAVPFCLLRARQANAPRAREPVQVIDQHEVGVVQEQEDRHLSVALVGRERTGMRYWKSSLAQGMVDHWYT